MRKIKFKFKKHLFSILKNTKNNYIFNFFEDIPL